jgi:hypothetical protein
MSYVLTQLCNLYQVFVSSGSGIHQCNIIRHNKPRMSLYDAVYLSLYLNKSVNLVIGKSTQ